MSGALGGCSSFKAPTLEAVGVTPAPAANGGQVITVRMKATNPNREPMPLEEAYYALSLDGRTVFNGRRSPQVTLPPYGEREFDLPTVVPGEALGDAETFDVRGNVTYRTPGELAETMFDSGLRRPSERFSMSGPVE